MRTQYKVLSEKYNLIKENEKEDILSGLDTFIQHNKEVLNATIYLIKDLIENPEKFGIIELGPDRHWDEIFTAVEEDMGWGAFVSRYLDHYLMHPKPSDYRQATKYAIKIEDNFLDHKPDPYANLEDETNESTIKKLKKKIY